MHIVDIFILWLLTIACMIETRLFGNVVMHVIRYVLCLFTWISIIDVCWLMGVVDPDRLLVVRVENLKRF